MDGNIILLHLLLWEHPSLLIPGSIPGALTPSRTWLKRRSVHTGGIQVIPMECWRRCQRNREALGALRERKRFSAFQAHLSSTEWFSQLSRCSHTQSNPVLSQQGHSPLEVLHRWAQNGDLSMAMEGSCRNPSAGPLLRTKRAAVSETHHSKGQGGTRCLSVLTSLCWCPPAGDTSATRHWLPQLVPCAREWCWYFQVLHHNETSFSEGNQVQQLVTTPIYF